MLLGMRVPTNYGPDYTEAFAAIYARVAKTERVELMPFLLEGVAGHPELNLDDGIHPNREGQRMVAELATRHELHPNLITQWKRQAIEKLAKVFDDKGFEVQANRDAEVTKLHAKIGQLVVERDFLAKAFDR